MADADPVESRNWRRLTREFLAELFDVRLTTFMATRMMPGVYGFGMVLAGMFTLYVVVLRFRDSLVEGLPWLVLGPLMFVGLVTALRIALEFVLALFRVAWYVEHVANHTQVVAQELPRFGFLRTLLFGKEPATPPAPRPGEPPRS
jgi:hypothetical protein